LSYIGVRRRERIKTMYKSNLREELRKRYDEEKAWSFGVWFVITAVFVYFGIHLIVYLIN